MPSIRDFSGGVLNQELLGKDNGAGIIIDARNVLSSWNGEIRKRTGTRIISQLDKKSRIIPYRLPNNDDALLVFTDGNVKGYEVSESGLIPLQIDNSVKLEYPLSGWVDRQNGDWVAESNILNSGTDSFSGVGGRINDRTQEMPKYLQFYNKTTPFMFASATVRFILGISDGYRYWYMTSPILQYSDDGVSWTPHPSNFALKQTFINGRTHWDTTFSDITITSRTGGELHKYWRILFRDFHNSIHRYDSYIEYQITETNFFTASGKTLDVATSFLENDLEKIKYAQADRNIYFACAKHTPFVIKETTSGIESKDFIPENTTDIWTENSYPSCVASFQNRLAFGGFGSYKNRVIMSEFGKFDNFTVKTKDVLPTDPISADCVELRSEIENLWAGNNALYALSSDGVSMLDAQGGIVATDQINFKLRNREPADGMTPTTKDDIMIYLGNDRRKIFITDYDFIVQRFKAKDLSIGYNGFLTSRIVAMHYASRKCSLIYGYHDNGDLLTLLFDPDLPKNALFPCNIGGEIKDMQVFKSGDKFRVLMVVQVEDRWYLVEKNEQPDYQLMDFMSEQEKQAYTDSVTQNGYYLDLMTQKFYESPVDIIDDVPYAVGEQVAVFADGKYIGEKICSAGGPYAWVDGTDLVYTKKVLPEAGDSLYDKDDQIIEDKKLVSVDGKKITVEVRGEDKVEVVDFYGWSCEKSITGPTLGKLVRNPERDSTYNDRYRFGWGDYYTSQPAVADEPAINADPWTYIEKANAVERIILYTLNLNPQVGDDVYDENFTIVGKIEEMGTTNTLFVSKPTVLTYVVFNGDKYYRNGRINTKHETAVPTYENHEYSRSVIDDLASGPVGVRLDEPAKSFLLGYNYDAYFVIKLATPYSQIKYPKEISTYFINTGYVEMGNSFDNLQPILNNLVDKLDIFDKPIFINGEYTKTMDKMDKSPYIIFRSKMPMPFMITGIDFKVDYSNYQGGI